MANDPEDRSLGALRAYLTGEGSVSLLRSGLHGVPRDTIREVLKAHRLEFERINPDRAVLLESFALSKS